MTCTLPLALTFLTKLPWPWRGEATSHDLATSLFWFPWVGALLGLGYWLAWIILPKILPAPAPAALLLALTVVATGGLHLDGLADTADGLGGGHTPEGRLRIMKDSRVGTFGVLALVLALLLKFACFTALSPTGPAPALVFFPLVSRWGMVLLAFLCPYARAEGGLGQAMTTGVTPQILAGASLSAAALSLLILGVRGLILMGLVAAFIWGASRYFQSRLGGITGDVLGAANEVLEVLVLVGALLT